MSKEHPKLKVIYTGKKQYIFINGIYVANVLSTNINRSNNTQTIYAISGASINLQSPPNTMEITFQFDDKDTIITDKLTKKEKAQITADAL